MFKKIIAAWQDLQSLWTWRRLYESRRVVLFKVIRRTDLHEYIIYENGEIEGFGEYGWISNHLSDFTRAAYLQGRSSQIETSIDIPQGALDLTVAPHTQRRHSSQ